MEGDAAPDFDLPTDGGGRVRLESLRGSPIVVYFYPKDDTSGCTKQAIAFSETKAEFDRIGARIVGISPDTIDQHEKFKEKHGLTVTLASDESKQVVEAYGVWTEKSMYGRRYMGVERSTFLIGPDGRIERIWRNVKVAGHEAEVLDAARRLAAASAG